MTSIRGRWVIFLISIEQISGEISALEEEKPTHVIMQKLAALYTVRDHMVLDARQITPQVQTVEIVPPLISESDFAQAITGKNIKDVLSLMDETMSTLSVVNPRLYESIMSRI